MSLHLATYLGLLHRSEQTLARAFRSIAAGHVSEADVFHTCNDLAAWSEDHVRQLAPLAERYGDAPADEPERLHHEGLGEPRSGGVGLLRDLQDLALLATLVQTSWIVVWDAAQALRDSDLIAVAEQCNRQTGRQLRWLDTRMKQAAPQALLVSA